MVGDTLGTNPCTIYLVMKLQNIYLLEDSKEIMAKLYQVPQT